MYFVNKEKFCINKIFVMAKTYDIRLIPGTSMLLAGPSKSDKSIFTLNLIKYKHEMLDIVP